MKNFELEKTQEMLTNMLISFHELCIKNGLRYYMVGGTCIGALRHKGFIPWDDDVDVAMPREDYQILLSLNEDCFSEEIKPMFYRNRSGCPIHFLRLVNINTTLIEDAYHNYVEGVYLDIFPLDGVKKEELENTSRLEKIWNLHAMIMKHCSTNQYTSFKVKFKAFVSKTVPLGILHRLLEYEMNKYDLNETGYCANFLGAYGMKEVVPVDYFGKPKLYQFEGYELFGPEQAEKYLNHIYGDYTKLPSPDKRVCRHDQFYINLELPMKEYIANGR